ncbi:MAG: hypothetical protein OQK82_01360 [Candidatus Pacearchaeota archaeon]|nr:hypothetical protein [Candidatus Pacearchaeota archaeon]
MTVHVVCFEGMSSISAEYAVTNMVTGLGLYNFTVHTVPFMKTKNMIEWCSHIEDGFHPSDKVLYVAKSWGAVRMCRMLRKTSRRVDWIITIDPSSLSRMFIPYPVKIPEKYIPISVNYYQTKGTPIGCETNGRNVVIYGVNHMSITTCPLVEKYVLVAIKRLRDER